LQSIDGATKKAFSVGIGNGISNVFPKSMDQNTGNSSRIERGFIV
jgi:hypothetical protein